MRNITRYLSKVAQNISPYQWEEGIPVGVLRFDANTMPNPPKSLLEFLDKMKLNCPINEYQDPDYSRLKKLIADYERVDKNMISVTNSGDEAIDILAKTFLDSDDYFLTTPPTYEMFTIQCEINRGIPLSVPLKKDTWEVNDEEIIKNSKDPKVKIIFLCNPNNPTGSVISRKTIDKIVKYSKSIILVDEVYREFYGKSCVRLLRKYKNLVILRSFSKFAAMAGARIGYLIADPILSQKFDAIRFPMGVSYLSYKLAEIVLEKDQDWIKEQIRMIKDERQRLTDAFYGFGFKVYPSQANFLLVNMGNKAKETCLKLRNKGIIVRDRSNKHYLSGCVRITVRSPQENNQLLKALEKAIL